MYSLSLSDVCYDHNPDCDKCESIPLSVDYYYENDCDNDRDNDFYNDCDNNCDNDYNCDLENDHAMTRPISLSMIMHMIVTNVSL